jgi:hypothetical protein
VRMQSCWLPMSIEFEVRLVLVEGSVLVWRARCRRKTVDRSDEMYLSSPASEVAESATRGCRR